MGPTLWNTLSPPSLALHTEHPVKVGTHHHQLLLSIVSRLGTANGILLSVYCAQWSNFMVHYRSPSQTRELWRSWNRFQNIITVIVRYHHCTIKCRNELVQIVYFPYSSPREASRDIIGVWIVRWLPRKEGRIFLVSPSNLKSQWQQRKTPSFPRSSSMDTQN